MKKKVILHLAVLFISLSSIAQPYSGTIFVDGDIITGQDSSALLEVSYAGKGMRTVFDRRVNNWTTVNAFLYSITWSDGLTSEAIVNPEFSTADLAKAEAYKYGWHIGQLPHCLRVDVDEIWIHKGVQLFGGGNNSILIHTDQTTLYENDGILEETLVHEASHTSLDAMHAATDDWLEAQQLDGVFISDYAENLPMQEDIAESFLMWLAVRYKPESISSEDYTLITKTIPNRLRYFDDINCDLFPFSISNPTSLPQVDGTYSEDPLYPNPTNGYVTLHLNDKAIYEVTVYNTHGKAVNESVIEGDDTIDLSSLPNGLYLFEIRSNGSKLTKYVVKN